MARSSCITHPGKQPLVIIRKHYLKLLDGNVCAAALLAVFEYWNDVRLSQRKQERTKAKLDHEYVPDMGLWVYKTIADLCEDIMGIYGESAVGKAVTVLIESGFVERKDNEQNPFDRTKMYRLNLGKLQSKVDEWADQQSDEDYDVGSESPARHLENKASTDCNQGVFLKEITPSLEITPDITTPTPSLENAFEEATPQDWRLSWERQVGKLKQSERKYGMDRFAEMSESMSVQELDGATRRFGGWLKGKSVINPVALFFKDPHSWAQDAPEPASRPHNPSGKALTPPAAPDLQETELPALAVRWNATVTDAEPVVVWPPSQKEQAAFQLAITDPQFQPNVDKWLLKCQELRSKGGEKAACLNFVWACTNWRKIINGGCSWMVAKFDDKSRRVTLEDRNNAAAAEYLAKLAAEEAALNG